MPFSWSDQQLAVFSHVEQNKGSLIVRARAGCAKTTTGVECAKRIKNRIFFGAFNKAIADVIVGKVATNPRCTAGTFHSIGFKLFREIRQMAKVDGYKVSTMSRELYPWDKKIRECINSAVSFAKLDGLGLDGMPEYTDLDAWRELFEAHDMIDDIPASISDERVFGDCARVFKQSLDMCDSKTKCVIDFDDMLYAPLYFQMWKPQRFDTVIVDEAQDTNETRLRLALSIIVDKGTVIAIGDDRQCQPTGTKVAVVIAKGTRWEQECVQQVPIEKLKVGDMVISYNQSDCSFIKGRKVTGRNKRYFNGNLVVASVDGLVSKYTPNHHCLVNFNQLRDKYCVYLMRKDGKFRVGMCRMSSTGRCVGGPMSRMKSEGAEEAWILEVYNTRREAYRAENLVTANFGIPQLMFTVKNNSTCVQQDLDYIWDNTKNNYYQGWYCLEAFGRDINYPLFSGALFKESLKRPIIVHASNILNGCLMLLYSDRVNVKRSCWKPVKITHEWYEGHVYSLEVENEHLYCADGIITHNCIYQFAGASSNAMEKIKERTHATELPLSVTYRCPRKIVEMVNPIVPDYVAAESNGEGSIVTIEAEEEPGNLQNFWKLCRKLDPTHDVILCRMTRPLVGVAKRLRSNGIPCMVEGNNGKSIISLMTKWGTDMTWGQYLTRMMDYVTKEAAKFRAKTPPQEEKAENLEEKRAIILDIADDPTPDTDLREVVGRVERMFGSGQDNGEVLHLCTVHRAKGREWKRVVLIGRNRYMPSPWAKSDEDMISEENVEYVAITRTMEELVLVNVPPKPKSWEDPEWWEL